MKAHCDTMVQECNNIRQEIQNIQVVPLMSNYSQRLRTALKSFKEDPYIIITKADKGDLVVVMDSEHYHVLLPNSWQILKHTNFED